MSARPKIKICGVTTPEDAVLAVRLGADYLGLNFYPPSPRAIEPQRGKEIRAAVAGAVPVVGVFVNRPTADVEHIAAAIGLDLLQFHGDETAEEVARFGDRAIKVFRRSAPPAPEELERYAGCWAFLFDTPHHQLYGGTGEAWSWERLVGIGTSKPIFVAGGIRPDNIAAAASIPGIYGLDISSGVEVVPGRKDAGLLQRLFSEVGDGESSDAGPS